MSSAFAIHGELTKLASAALANVFKDVLRVNCKSAMHFSLWCKKFDDDDLAFACNDSAATEGRDRRSIKLASK